MAKATFFGCGQFRTFRPRFGFGQRYHLNRHGQLALKQFRLSGLNEMQTNAYTCHDYIITHTHDYIKARTDTYSPDRVDVSSARAC